MAEKKEYDPSDIGAAADRSYARYMHSQRRTKAQLAAGIKNPETVTLAKKLKEQNNDR